MSKRNVLFITPYAVVPPRYGGPLRVYNLCRELSRFYRVFQFAQQIQRKFIAFSLDPVLQHVTPTYTEYSCRNPLSIILYALTSLKWGAPPIWQNALLHITAPRWLRKHIEKADIIHVEHPWQFKWVYRQVRNRKPVILGAQNVEADLYTIALLKAPMFLAQQISHMISQQEQFAIQHATHIITTSAADRTTLAERYNVPLERLSVAPNGVDCTAFTPVSPELRKQRKEALQLSGKQVVLFAGSLHQPNIEAVKLIIKWASQWPEPDVRFLIVGTVGQAFSYIKHPYIHFTGSVEQTQPFFEAADVAINPMLSGSGTNIKQLEFMAMGLPTLASPVGARGVPLEDGVHGYICTLDTFCSHLHWVLAHPEVYNRVGNAARLFVEQYFDWRVIVTKVVNIYSDLDKTGILPNPC